MVSSAKILSGLVLPCLSMDIGCVVFPCCRGNTRTACAASIVRETRVNGTTVSSHQICALPVIIGAKNIGTCLLAEPLISGSSVAFAHVVEGPIVVVNTAGQSVHNSFTLISLLRNSYLTLLLMSSKFAIMPSSPAVGILPQPGVISGTSYGISVQNGTAILMGVACHQFHLRAWMFVEL